MAPLKVAFLVSVKAPPSSVMARNLRGRDANLLNFKEVNILMLSNGVCEILPSFLLYIAILPSPN